MNDARFKALADPTRREILQILGDGPKTAGEIAAHFDITAPSMSHHFRILREVDLVTDERRGRQIVYALNTTVVQDLLRAVLDIVAPTKREPKEPVRCEPEPRFS